MVLLLLAELGHVGIVLVFLLFVFLLDVFFRIICHSCGICHYCELCHSCGLSFCRLLSGCISVDNIVTLVYGHSCNGAVMVWTGRV